MDEKILKYWNDLYAKDDFFGIGPTKLAKLAQTLIKKNKTCSILELGCGQGRDAIFFSQMGHDVTALDISPNAIEFVKKTKDLLGIRNLKPLVFDIEKPLTFNQDSFDLIYSNLVLQFFEHEKLNLFFNHIAKVLKKSSPLIFSTKKIGDKYYNFGKKVNENAFEYKGIIRYFYDSEQLKSLLSEKFDILQFDADEHTNLDSTVSVWWKIIVEKK